MWTSSASTMTGTTTTALTGGFRLSDVIQMIQQINNSNRTGNVKQMTIVNVLEFSDVLVAFMLYI